ncbi:MAG: DUF882 domain-containing protein [Rhodopseudomonas sp.]|nr:DUF882 domain-containing protein [Rhodopseudomonas sp.]
MAAIGGSTTLQTASAEGDTRTLSFRHLHTGETITITYKRDGRYDQAALKKLDWFMRDWRRSEQTQMDPRLFDLLWETYREVGGKAPIEVICGYRAPDTNAMLRTRSRGVAQNSQHINGQAIDFEIPGVPLEKIREVGLRLQRGGVGFYPTSGSPFVHLDTGNIRHWPRIARAELQRIFPDGRTVHVPSDGKPLRNYALALADVEARGNEPNGVSLAAARNAGIDTGNTVTASLSAANKAKPKRSFLASLFGGNLTDEEDGKVSVSRKAAMPAQAQPKPLAKPVAVARITPQNVPMPTARPVKADDPATLALAQASTKTNSVFAERGLWTGAVTSGALPQPANQTPFTVASSEPTALGYAAEARDRPRRAARGAPPSQIHARPMGTSVPAATAAIPARPVASVEPVSYTERFTPALSGGFGRADSPWLRAAMLTPSVTGAMTATPLTRPHMEPLAAMLVKPAQSLVMTFSDDPHLGMVASRFSGPAVTFLATATFIHQQTASLK